MAVIAGLGNPGKKYSGTRHNIGFSLVDKLSEKISISLSSGKGPFMVGKGTYQGIPVYLAKPTTYMNNSGDALQQLLNWYKLDTEDCLVCYDDLNLNIGNLRLRPGGSAGGHNGIKDIINKLGTNAFPRLRIGIGDNFNRGQQVNYVLSPFSNSEHKIMSKTLDEAVEACICFITKNIDEAMNNFN